MRSQADHIIIMHKQMSQCGIHLGHLSLMMKQSNRFVEFEKSYLHALVTCSRNLGSFWRLTIVSPKTLIF